MRFSRPVIAAAFLTVSFLALPAAADDWHGHGGPRPFNAYEMDHWRHGQWLEGFHDGHNGWWWIVDGAWYYYPAPVYPYPEPYTPASAPLPAPLPMAAPVVAAPPSYLYYCPNPAGYYPTVPQCLTTWQQLAPTPTPPAVVIQKPMPVPPPMSPPVPEPGMDPRTDDMNQLRMLETEFGDVNIKDKYARAALQGLSAQVEEFRQSLYQRNYNAMDLLRHAEILQHSIDAELATLKHKPAPAH